MKPNINAVEIEGRKYVSATEAMNYLGLSLRTIYNMMDKKNSPLVVIEAFGRQVIELDSLAAEKRAAMPKNRRCPREPHTSPSLRRAPLPALDFDAIADVPAALAHGAQRHSNARLRHMARASGRKSGRHRTA